jgi:hypothetical protein
MMRTDSRPATRLALRAMSDQAAMKRQLKRPNLAVGAFVTIAIACASGLASVANGADGQQASSLIRSLTISGTAGNPTFTIMGTHLTVPHRNPAQTPTGQPLCPSKTSGPVGYDYGTHFYLIAWDGQPAGRNNALYSAGRYRPSLNELDCIGLIVLSHSPTKVVFTFGHAYAQFRSQYRELENGDVIDVALNGSSIATVVHFHH